MNSAELYRELKEAYTEENLHRISSLIIDLFRDHNHNALKYILKLVNNHTPCDEEKINKVFSKLIMLYHPDRLNQAVRYIDTAKIGRAHV